MDWQELSKIIGAFLLCAVKFSLAGVPAAVIAGWPILKSLTIIISGGVFGVLVFGYLSDYIIHFFKRFKKPNAKPKKKFTYANKLVIKTKNKFGLIGISILTPLLLSIPLGVFLAIRFFKNRNKVITYMILSVVGWAFILYFLLKNFYNLFFD